LRLEQAASRRVSGSLIADAMKNNPDPRHRNMSHAPAPVARIHAAGPMLSLAGRAMAIRRPARGWDQSHQQHRRQYSQELPPGAAAVRGETR
jgi:hypothetical protein